MMYSVIGILASIILLIINRDALWNHSGEFTQTQKYYRNFLLGVLSYYITDLLWGILDTFRLTALEFADTAVYFIAMAASVMLWTRYVVSYLESDNIFGKILYNVGALFLCLEAVAVAVNCFYPIMFWFDENGGYHAGNARHITLVIQIVLFLLTSIYTLYVSSKSAGKVRRRHMTICLFGVAMVILIALQVAYPLLPLYAMGFMLGTCLLHTFVIEDEEEEYRQELEKALKRERDQMVELNKSRESLRDALTIAEEANNAKTTFLSNMSLEIRTPLNAIIGLDNLALQSESVPEETRAYLEKIDGSANHLLGLINDILDMSRIESGRQVLRKETFSFAMMLEQLNTMVTSQCEEKGLQYESRVIGQVDREYIGDEMKLKQVLINILGNAIKFTDAPGKISLTVERTAEYGDHSTLRFCVSDTGIGMDEEFIPHVFDTFAQEDSSRSSKYGSTGLGMAITKSIVELMNGTISVKSEKGKGSEFTVVLTLMNAAGSGSDSEESGPVAETLEEKQRTDLQGRHILIAEDVQINAEIIKQLITMREAEIDHAINGKEVLEMFRNSSPGYYDAILMDVRMPEMDGLDAAKAIRALDRADAKNIPIIALTANAFDEDVQRSMQAGMNAHLSKPVEPEHLYQVLEESIWEARNKI